MPRATGRLRRSTWLRDRSGRPRHTGARAKRASVNAETVSWGLPTSRYPVVLPPNSRPHFPGAICAPRRAGGSRAAVGAGGNGGQVEDLLLERVEFGMGSGAGVEERQWDALTALDVAPDRIYVDFADLGVMPTSTEEPLARKLIGLARSA